MINDMVGDEWPQPPSDDVYPHLPRTETPEVAATRSTMKSAVRRLSAILAATAVAVAAGVPYYGTMFYDVYWTKRDCFNTAGYCDYRDAAGESHRVFAQNGLFFGALAGMSVAGAVALAVVAWWSWRRYTARIETAEPAQ